LLAKDVNDNACLLVKRGALETIASKLACMFRLEGVGGTKSSIPTLTSTDRGRLLVPPFLPEAPIRNSSVKPTIEASQRKGKPRQALKP